MPDTINICSLKLFFIMKKKNNKEKVMVGIYLKVQAAFYQNKASQILTF